MTAMQNKFRVKLRGFDPKLVDEGAKNIVDVVKKSTAEVLGPIPLPTKIEKFTVLKSPHINKKSREQFEIRTHYRLIDVLNPTQEVMGALMKLELPSGVDVQVKQ